MLPSECTTTSFGRVETFTLVTVHEHGNAAVVFGARHAAGAMLAGDQAPLAVARVAVAVVGRATENTDRAGRPSQRIMRLLGISLQSK